MTAALRRRVLRFYVELLAMNALELPRRTTVHVLVEDRWSVENVHGDADIGVGWNLQGRHVNSGEGRFVERRHGLPSMRSL